MMHCKAFCLVGTLSITAGVFAAPASLQTDILVIGGSFSAPAAALAAARTNPSAQVLLAEPEDWLGGQATAQGVSAIDNAWHNPGASIMRNDPPSYYPADYLSFLDTIKNKPSGAPGTGMVPNGAAWVTREGFDPRTAAWVLDQMTAVPTNLTVMKMTVAKDVVTESVTDAYGTGKRIRSVTLIQRTPKSGYIPYTKMLSQELKDRYSVTDSADFSKTVYTVTSTNAAIPLIVIDTSETGDIIVPAGADYTVGRELTTEEIGDDNSLPAYEEHGSQATVFVHCMAGVTATTPLNEESLKAPWFNFESYYNTQRDYYFGFGSHTWKSIWTYRRIYCDGNTGMYNPNVGDVSMQNWYPGNDYPYGSIYLNKADATAQYNGTDGWYGGLDMEHLATAEKHAVAWYFYMKNNKPSDVSWQTRFPCGFDDDKNMMATASGIAKFPYIRCCRRILGIDNFRMMNRYFVDTTKSNYVSPTTSFRYYDSVGIGNYAVDIHPIKNTSGLSPTMVNVAPFYLPYRSLASNNIRNLLVGGKQIAGTFLTNAAYRLHPIEWVIGSASGTAAGLMRRDNEDNRALLNLTKLHELQNKVSENSPIHWKSSDTVKIPPKDGDLVVNDFKTINAGTPFRLEAFAHPLVTHASFTLNNIAIGESTTKAAGRIVLNNVVSKLATGTYEAKAITYDASNQVLATLTTNVNLVNDLDIEYDIPIVIDDGEEGFSTEGTWTVASSQANRYGPTYHYSWASEKPSSATWHFSNIPTGLYKVSTFYPNASNRSTQAPFVVTHSDGETTVKIDQIYNGGEWVNIGEFNFNSTDGATIKLVNDIGDSSERLVCADAVRIMRNLATIVSLSNWELY